MDRAAAVADPAVSHLRVSPAAAVDVLPGPGPRESESRLSGAKTEGYLKETLYTSSMESCLRVTGNKADSENSDRIQIMRSACSRICQSFKSIS